MCEWDIQVRPSVAPVRQHPLFRLHESLGQLVLLLPSVDQRRQMALSFRWNIQRSSCAASWRISESCGKQLERSELKPVGRDSVEPINSGLGCSMRRRGRIITELGYWRYPICSVMILDLPTHPLIGSTESLPTGF